MAAVAARLTVLFICTGNVHRSPLAERLLAARLPEARVGSAGTMAQHIMGMHPATRSVLEQLGGDGAGFTSRRLTPELVSEADLVLGLDREHRETAVRLWPVALRKCFTVREFLRLSRGGGEPVWRSESAHGDVAPPREVISRAAAARGSLAPVSRAEDGITDPCGAPYDVLLACGQEIDEAAATLAALLRERGRAQRTEC
ncbi:low molecular weight phosphatase family protein [Streptomyces sp. QHH-9511]|uniref:arsenate-mycothiol transferase ArsC n=1 Tax=Streptomyces sp. QHH-9511 TaxID=2684468 RepID=UPI0013162B55|nr:low molecular weight phosphatase family protein [Streptomyces sp. QHH-9511]QGZ52506.1 low molecular weight phosphatase family protein [Streptomyces sp. QHH-9511]